jgi:hypothetical protein
LPKPHALAVQEWLDGKIYYRDSTKKSTMSVLSGKKVLLEFLVELPPIKQRR